MVASIRGEFTEASMIGHSTLEYTRPDGTRVIRFHLTDVVTIAQNGTLTLNSGGFQTATTKKRINEYLPWGWDLFQSDHVWYVGYRYGENRKRYLFEDGMTIAPDGTVTGAKEG
jgi:hypothetical protein